MLRGMSTSNSKQACKASVARQAWQAVHVPHLMSATQQQHSYVSCYVFPAIVAYLLVELSIILHYPQLQCWLHAAMCS